jgi:hypothetical protein
MPCSNSWPPAGQLSSPHQLESLKMSNESTMKLMNKQKEQGIRIAGFFLEKFNENV